MSMRARTTVAAALSTVLSLSLAACGGDSGSGSDGKAASVGIAMPTKTSQRWLNDGQNMVDELKGFGYTTTLKYADNDPKNQVAQVEAMIDSGVDALVIASVNGKAFNDVLEKAKSADIPVISYDRLILGSPNVAYYASFDNVKVGTLQADFITEGLGLVNGSGKGPFTVELFAGAPDDNNTRYFYEASMEVLEPYIQSGDLIVRSGETEMNEVTTPRWDGPTAEKRMNKLLDSEYADQDIDAVLSPYDGMSIGIIKALKEHGYGTAAKPLPIVTGQDAEVPSVKSIMADEQAQTVYKDTRELALVTAYMVNSVVHGKKPALNDLQTYDNGKKVVPAYLLEPVSVDKSNCKQVLVDSGYIKKSDLK
ncbi:multiple monosaccharide ABC transporter substrate-binding protein [Streptomyces sp. MMBL 11-3]|uniref:multiple monosaccharide ABC transporter substrate-binding protein n=1 Tax=Streptomyces sp. MMBL 11-3 TaxID=3382639 RepID=UPI0039B390F1